MSTLLDIQRLSVDFRTRRGTIHAIRDVTLSIRAGKRYVWWANPGAARR